MTDFMEAARLTGFAQVTIFYGEMKMKGFAAEYAAEPQLAELQQARLKAAQAQLEARTQASGQRAAKERERKKQQKHKKKAAKPAGAAAAAAEAEMDVEQAPAPAPTSAPPARQQQQQQRPAAASPPAAATVPTDSGGHMEELYGAAAGQHEGVRRPRRGRHLRLACPAAQSGGNNVAACREQVARLERRRRARTSERWCFRPYWGLSQEEGRRSDGSSSTAASRGGWPR